MKESSKVDELKATLGGILKVDKDQVRLTKPDETELVNGKTLEECGVKQSTAKVVDPMEVKMALKVNDVFEKPEVTPYSVPPPLPEAMARGLSQ